MEVFVIADRKHGLLNVSHGKTEAYQERLGIIMIIFMILNIQPLKEPVDSSFCPQTGRPIQTKACSLRCKKDCVLTNWSQWLNCDCNSGPNGIQGIGKS